MNQLLKLARRRSGQAAFERSCRCTMELGKRRKACFVPGTQEHGQWVMLVVATSQEHGRLKEVKS